MTYSTVGVLIVPLISEFLALFGAHILSPNV